MITPNNIILNSSSWYLFYFTYRCRGIFRTEGNQGHVGLFDYWNIPPAEKKTCRIYRPINVCLKQLLGYFTYGHFWKHS